MDDLTWLTAWRLRDLMIAKTISPVDVTKHFLQRIDDLDKTLHSFITVAHEQALTAARDAERLLMVGEEAGPLFGIPLSIKDNYWTKDIRTTAGSLLFKDFQPSEDSVYAERSRRAGAIIIGKTNLPEFATYPRTINRLGPECVNPWDIERISGGSSGGAAASVAAALNPLAIGSDGGGSIRIPAALCGVLGLHPSNGRVPRYGGIGGSLVFSGAGPMTRDVRDAAMLFQALAGPDPRDPSCMHDTPPDYLSNLNAGIRGVRMHWIGNSGEMAGLDSGVVAQCAKAALRFEEAGAHVEQTDLSLEVEQWFDAFYLILDADRYAFIGQQIWEDPAQRGLLSEYAREHFARARNISAVEYVRALRAKMRLTAKLNQIFETCDLVLTPTVARIAPRIDGPVVRQPLVAFTFIVNYSGFTAATVPCGFIDGLPIGMQIIGRPNTEPLVLRAARAFEQIQAWSSVRPKLFDRTLSSRA